MILIDTHVLVWLLNSPSKLSSKAQTGIQNTIKKDGKISISSMSIWEIFLLFKKGKLESDMDADSWLTKVEKLPFLEFIPVNNAIAAKSVMLPEFAHKDPADRIIIATAREYGATLITSDGKLLNYKHVKSLW